MSPVTTLLSSPRNGTVGDHLARMPYHNAASQHHNLYTFTDQARGSGSAIRIGSIEQSD